MLADTKRELATELGILHKQDGVALRATFIVDPQNVIRWAWVKYHQYVQRYGAAMHDATYAHLSFVRLRSRHEVDAFLA